MDVAAIHEELATQYEAMVEGLAEGVKPVLRVVRSYDLGFSHQVRLDGTGLVSTDFSLAWLGLAGLGLAGAITDPERR